MSKAQWLFDRLVCRKEQRMMEAAEADAGFDGGEWSGPWHMQQFEKEVWRLAKRVGRHYHVQPEDLIS